MTQRRTPSWRCHPADSSGAKPLAKVRGSAVSLPHSSPSVGAGELLIQLERRCGKTSDGKQLGRTIDAIGRMRNGMRKAAKQELREEAMTHVKLARRAGMGPPHPAGAQRTLERRSELAQPIRRVRRSETGGWRISLRIATSRSLSAEANRERISALVTAAGGWLV